MHRNLTAAGVRGGGGPRHRGSGGSFGRLCRAAEVAGESIQSRLDNYADLFLRGTYDMLHTIRVREIGKIGQPRRSPLSASSRAAGSYPTSAPRTSCMPGRAPRMCRAIRTSRRFQAYRSKFEQIEVSARAIS